MFRWLFGPETVFDVVKDLKQSERDLRRLKLESQDRSAALNLIAMRFATDSEMALRTAETAQQLIDILQEVPEVKTSEDSSCK